MEEWNINDPNSFVEFLKSNRGFRAPKLIKGTSTNIGDLDRNSFTVGSVKPSSPLLKGKGTGSSSSTSQTSGNGQSTGAIITQNEQAKFHDPTKELKQAYLDKAANKILDRFLASKGIKGDYSSDANEFIANRGAIAQNYNQFAQDKNGVSYQGAQFNTNNSQSSSKESHSNLDYATNNSPMANLPDQVRVHFNDMGQGSYKGEGYQKQMSKLVMDENDERFKALGEEEKSYVRQMKQYIKSNVLSVDQNAETGEINVGINTNNPNARDAATKLHNFITLQRSY